MNFDSRNLAFLKDTSEAAVKVLKTVGTKNKNVRRLELTQKVAENLVYPINMGYDIINSKYLFEQKSPMYIKPSDTSAKEEAREREKIIINELKDSWRHYFLNKFKIIYNLGYGHEVRENVYSIDRHNMSRTKYMIILRVADELIAEFLRGESLNTIKSFEKNHQKRQ